MSQSISNTQLYGVSLGPGDPDLITLKGLSILKHADKIYFPGSLFKNGRKSSYSQTILEHYDLDSSKWEGFFLEMNLNRIQVQDIYEVTFQSIKKDIDNGLTVAIVSEGDLSTFSSFSYILEKVEAHQISIELIPGITSYAMSAAEHQSPLCLQNQKLIILPRVQSVDELQEALTHFDTVVLMKISSVMDVVNTVLQNKTYTIRYSERLGTADQYITTSLEDINQRKIPYFSLITIHQ